MSLEFTLQEDFIPHFELVFNFTNFWVNTLGHAVEIKSQIALTCFQVYITVQLENLSCVGINLLTHLFQDLFEIINIDIKVKKLAQGNYVLNIRLLTKILVLVLLGKLRRRFIPLMFNYSHR